MGLGFIRKALFVLTGGLSGRVFKDDSKNKRTVKAAGKPALSQKKPKPQAARRAKPQAKRRAKPRATRPSKPQSPARSTVAPAVGSGTGTATVLERLAKLHGQGELTDEEFAAAKARVLGGPSTPPESARAPATFQSVEANVAAARRLADLAGQDQDASVTTLSSD